MHLALFHNLNEKTCLIVGAGKVATRKARMLLPTGANIIVLSPECSKPMKSLMNDHPQIHWVEKEFSPEDVSGAKLVISTVDDYEINKHVAEVCHRKGVDVNVVDNPDLCTVIMPAMVNRDPVQVAVSTAGASPVLARLLKARISENLPARVGKLAALAQRYRADVEKKIAGVRERKNFWEDVLEGPIADHVYAGREGEAEKHLKNEIDKIREGSTCPGEVHVVHCGNGEADLLSRKALKLIQRADVVFYDEDTNDEIQEEMRRDAERILLSQYPLTRSMSSKDLERFMLSYAEQGFRVVHLVSGWGHASTSEIKVLSNSSL